MMESRDIVHSRNVCQLKIHLSRCLPEVENIQPLPIVPHGKTNNILLSRLPIPWNHFPKDPRSDWLIFIRCQPP